MTGSKRFKKIYNEWWHGKDKSPDYDDIGFLITMIEEMEKTLDFYADRESWKAPLKSIAKDGPLCYHDGDGYYQDPGDVPVISDNGTKARKILGYREGMQK